VITSHHNPLLKDIRRLQRRRDGRFVAEGEDLLAAADAAGWASVARLRAGVDVDAEVLARVSSLGSGSRELGVFQERWAPAPVGPLCVCLHGVGDPGNVGAVLRSAHAFGAGSVVLGPDCADPFGPKAVRASMGSLFARPPARAGLNRLTGTLVALDRAAGRPLDELELQAPVVLCLGAEREGVSVAVLERASEVAHIPMRAAGPESLNVAMAASVALYAAARRMAADG